jgi:hypothetical protein
MGKAMDGIQFNCSERYIEDVLANNCEHFLDLKFIARQFQTDVGIIDLIARHPEDRESYFVIELKRGVIDPQAYVQVVRYANWLNSEYSKDGRRKFFPVLIGESLSSTLDHVCAYFDTDQCLNLANIYRPSYRLFKFDPMTGISFAWFSTGQQAAADKPQLQHCHISALSEQLEYANYSLERVDANA